MNSKVTGDVTFWGRISIQEPWNVEESGPGGPGHKLQMPLASPIQGRSLAAESHRHYSAKSLESSDNFPRVCSCELWLPMMNYNSS